MDNPTIDIIFFSAYSVNTVVQNGSTSMAPNFLPDFGDGSNFGDGNFPLSPSEPTSGREPIRHLLFGSPVAVRRSILILHRLGYAEPSAWSRLQQTNTPGQVMSVLTQHLRIE